MITKAVLIAVLIGTGLGPKPQAEAIAHYVWQESRFDPCANSRTGESLLGVTGPLRKALHDFAGTKGCVPAYQQILFLAREWPRRYPVCEARFRKGDLGAFKRCWGRGRSR